MRLGSAWWLVCAMSLGIATVACTESGDIGYPCTLVRSDGDGGIIPLTYGDLGPGQDIDVISFGSIQCEDFICVRHRYAPRLADDQPVQGTCSRGCTAGLAGTCAAVSGEADLADGPFTCRSLVLDPETLAAVCGSANPPPICGTTDQSDFCAQGAIRPEAKQLDGGSPDAGT